MNTSRDDTTENAIIRVQGGPVHPDRPDERTCWECFKEWIFPSLKRGNDLADAFADARVRGERNKADKVAKEAAEIAARTDSENQRAVGEFNTIIDDIFKSDGLPPGAKALKLAKLLEANPAIAEKLDRVMSLLDRLHYTKGVSIQPIDDDNELASKALSVDAPEQEA
jgi:hypothetical protein